ncbi:MAG: plasmid pRiA4b ORF-3 family protein [Intrasporangiaceae bacterium]|nr:plasmid pRiA4b ORF-3 family protein [Intrasporangiaceae bacterium]
MSRRSGPRRPPNRAATRRGPARRSHPEIRAEDQPLIVALREALHRSPVAFGALVCQFLGVLRDDDLTPDKQVPTPAQFVEPLLGVDIAETTNALHVIAAITDDEILAARIRRALPERRQPVSPVVERFVELEVVDCYRLTHPLVASEYVVLPLRWPDGTEGTLLLYVDATIGGALADVSLDDQGHAEQLAVMEGVAEEHGMLLVSATAAEARARTVRALERWQALEQPPTTDSWPGLYAFLTLVLDRMPDEPVELDDALPPLAPGSAFDFTPRVNTPIPLPAPPTTPQLATLRIELLDSEPEVWRQVAVRSDLTLDRLADIVNTAVGWAGGHLHRFTPGASPWQGPYFIADDDAVEGEVGTLESEARVDQVLRKPGDELVYVYDFGDDWEHLISLEGFVPLGDLDVRAICLDGERAGPLEDVGGIDMHNELVATLSQRGGRSRPPEELRDWVPLDYDPADFDLTAVNVGLTLQTQSPEELLDSYRSRFGEPVRPELAEGLDRLIDRVRPDDLAIIVALVTELTADGADGEVVTSEDKLAALAHVQVLLDEAGEDGIPLTSAGWMKPDVVVRLVEALGLRLVYGKGNRENNTREVMALREAVVEVGLLRKHKGRLLLTAAGRKARGDVDVLWRHIVGRLAGSKDAFEREARGLYLLQIAGGVDSRRAHDELARILSRAGWRIEGYDRVIGYACYRATDTPDALLGVSLREWRQREQPEETVVRRLARDSVILGG